MKERATEYRNKRETGSRIQKVREKVCVQKEIKQSDEREEDEYKNKWDDDKGTV